jgi:hypothetical protein
LAITLCGDIDSSDTPIERGQLQIWNPAQPEKTTTLSPVGRLGSIAAIGNDHLLAMYDHLRLVEVATGSELFCWNELRSGTQTSSILISDPAMPIMAVDTAGLRFAIAAEEKIVVVQLARHKCQ